MGSRPFVKSVAAAVLYSVVLIGALGGAGAAGAMHAEQPSFVEPAGYLPNTEAPTDRAGSDPVGNDTVVGPSLEQATGEREVLVLFGEAREALDDTDRSVRTLKQVAAEAQRPLETFASARDDITVEEQFWITPGALVTVDTGSDALARLADLEGVTRVQSNARESAGGDTGERPPGRATVGRSVSPESAGSADNETFTWALDAINLSSTWSTYGTRGNGTTVAVLDSGVAVEEHPELAPIEGGWRDFVEDRPEPYDDLGHGTRVTGIVAGETDSTGVQYGVAPDVDLVHGKVLDSTDRWQGSDLLNAFEWLTTHEAGVDVVVTSLFTDRDYEQGLIDAVQNARSNGITTVGIAGNSGPGTSTSPGNIHEALSVGATDRNNRLWEASGGELVDTDDAWGFNALPEWPSTYLVPDVVAPGVDVPTAFFLGGHSTVSGTSYAAPHVGGVIALMESATEQNLSTGALRRLVRESATVPGTNASDIRYGHGIVDAYDAVGAATNPAETPELSAAVDERPVPAGESTSVTVTIEGTSERTTNQTLSIHAGDDRLASKELTVPSNDTVTVTRDWTPGSESTTVQRVDASVGDVSITEVVDIVEGPRFEITNVHANESVAAGERAVVEARVTNLGETAGNGTVTAEFADAATRTESLTLGQNESATVAFSVVTEADDTGETTVTVASPDDEATTAVTVTDSPDDETTSAAENDDGSGPGFGVVAALIGVGAAAYLLKRRRTDSPARRPG